MYALDDFAYKSGSSWFKNVRLECLIFTLLAIYYANPRAVEIAFKPIGSSVLIICLLRFDLTSCDCVFHNRWIF